MVRRHWHALVRDVLDLGYRSSDMFTTLSLAEMVSIVIGAGPNSAVRYCLNEGWSRESHLLANIAEGNAGMAKLMQPYERPGIDDRMPAPNPNKMMSADVMTWDEMERRDKERYARAGKYKPRTSGSRPIAARPGDRQTMLAAGDAPGTKFSRTAL